MKLYPHDKLLDEEDDYGMGGGGSESIFDDEMDDSNLDDDDSQLDDDDGGQTDQGEQVGQRNGQPVRRQVQQQPALTPDQIAEAVARGVSAAPIQRQPEKLTEAEIRRRTNYFEVKQEHVNAILDPNTPAEVKIKTLQTLLDGTVNHALTMSGMLMRKSFDEEVQPIRQYVDARTRKENTDNFLRTTVKKYPALKAHGRVVQSALTMLRQEGFQPKSYDEAVTRLAQLSESLIKSVSSEFSLRQQPVQRQNGSRLSPMLSGRGGGGSGGRGAQSSGKKAFETVFE